MYDAPFLHLSVTVSLVSIKGTDCRIVELGQVADKTGGQVKCFAIIITITYDGI